MDKQIEIFLSYANPDQQRVLQVYNYLQNNGYTNTWIDCEKLLPGQNWDYEIQKNLKKADIILIFLSENSVNRRSYVQKEIKLTLRYLEEKLKDDIYIIPIQLDDITVVPEQLSHLHCLKVDSENALIKLKQSLDNQSKKLNKELPITYNTNKKTYITKSSVAESWDGVPGYEVEFDIPIFQSTTYNNISEISKIIEADFIVTLQENRYIKFDQSPDLFSWTEEKFRRTNLFGASYSDIFQSFNFLSVHYNIYWYSAGAAHPNQNYVAYNFVLDPLIRIVDVSSLFKKPGEVLKKLISFVRDKIKEEKTVRLKEYNDDNSLDKTETDLINKKIKDWKSLAIFSFTDTGLLFSFPPYAVGPYSEGSYHVEVPYKIFCKDLKREFHQALPITYNDDFGAIVF